jgi:hypothetical protein
VTFLISVGKDGARVPGAIFGRQHLSGELDVCDRRSLFDGDLCRIG